MQKIHVTSAFPALQREKGCQTSGTDWFIAQAKTCSNRQTKTVQYIQVKKAPFNHVRHGPDRLRVADLIQV